MARCVQLCMLHLPWAFLLPWSYASAWCGESDLFVLHCVFLQVINSHLGSFMRAWNLHPLRTESNWSSIWLNSTLKYVEKPEEVMQNFSIDFDWPLPRRRHWICWVPDTVCQLSDDQLSEFMALAGSIAFHTFVTHTHHAFLLFWYIHRIFYDH